MTETKDREKARRQFLASIDTIIEDLHEHGMPKGTVGESGLADLLWEMAEGIAALDREAHALKRALELKEGA